MLKLACTHIQFHSYYTRVILKCHLQSCIKLNLAAHLDVTCGTPLKYNIQLSKVLCIFINYKHFHLKINSLWEKIISAFCTKHHNWGKKFGKMVWVDFRQYVCLLLKLLLIMKHFLFKVFTDSLFFRSRVDISVKAVSKASFLCRVKPLIVITFRQRKTDIINWMITIPYYPITMIGW